MKQELETHTRKSVSVDLSDYCIFSKKLDDYGFDVMEVTEWSNGSGYDIYLSTRDLNDNIHKERFSLTEGQFEALSQMIKKLNE